MEGAGVRDMHAREEMERVKVRVNSGCGRAVSGRPGGSSHANDRVRAVVVARLRNPHLMPDPRRRAFPRIMRRIVGWRITEDAAGGRSPDTRRRMPAASRR